MKKLIGAAAAVFLIAAATGYIGYSTFTSDKYVESFDIRVDNDNDKQVVNFDGHSVELRYENFEEAKFYYGFNDSRRVQQIEDLVLDGTLRRMTDIKSFGNQTYLLHLKYQDDPEKTGDGWMQLYKIEEM